jgi:hypothetical protein
MTIMEIFEYLTGKGGIIVLGLIVLVIFIFRKWKEKRYFKDVEKRIKKNDD